MTISEENSLDLQLTPSKFDDDRTDNMGDFTRRTSNSAFKAQKAISVGGSNKSTSPGGRVWSKSTFRQ